MVTESVAPEQTASEGSEADPDATEPDRLRRHAPLIVFVAIELVALPLLLFWGRHGWFTQDDWDFLSARTAGNAGDLFRAHFQHWVTLPILVYRVWWNAFGMRNYAPYQVLSVVTHLVAAALVLVVMRRAGVRPWLATIAAGVFVFFGAGAENILVAFQITFVGALVFGLVHLLLADHDGPISGRDWLGLLAGLAGLMCSGVAATMIAVVGLAVLLRRGLRGWPVALFHTVPLGALYLLWLELSPTGQDAGNYRSHSPAQVSKFVGIGFEAAFGRLGHLTGVGIALAAVLIGGLFVLFRSQRRRWPLGNLGAPMALLAGALVFLVVTGVARSGQGALLFLLNGTGPDRARDSRYVYIVAAMLVPALALAADALIRLKWQLAIPIVAVLLVGVPGNIHQLMSPTEYFANAHASRAEILSIPTLPGVEQLRGSGRLVPVEGGRFAAEGLTYSWLVGAREAGELPRPPQLDPTLRATTILRLFLVPKVVTTPAKCGAPGAATVVTLDHGDPLTIQGGDAYVRYVPPGEPRSIVVLYKTGSYVALVGPMRLRVIPASPGARICL